MKRLEFKSAKEAIEHLKKLGGKRVEWTRITTGWSGSPARTSGRFVTKRPWKKQPDRFSTRPVGNVRA